MSERIEALCAAATVVERERKSNPINGDCSNSTLSRALDAIVRLAGDEGPAVLAAVQAVRDQRAAEEGALYERLRAENAARREATQ